MTLRSAAPVAGRNDGNQPPGRNMAYDGRMMERITAAVTRQQDKQRRAAIMKDGTRTENVNGKPRVFYPTLDEAIAVAMRDGQVDITNTQALEYANRFPMRDNSKDPHDLYREILDCDEEKHNSDYDSFCFTTVIKEDKEPDESMEDFIDGWTCYQVWRND